ncbi:ras association domain-containing protein 4-like [Oscarella lobularis]|uniref:ras association domain-containing protein 4-like n=1 Tax=Oscarella lobularis TaxID=121494 RepID=UPI00331339FF
MPNCPKCGKAVYFAERISSIGYDWHPACLRCVECGKRLHPGRHAEHKGKPYCDVPCYSALFGPVGYGRGGVTEHALTTSVATDSPTKATSDSADLASKIRQYNLYLQGKLEELTSREIKGKLIFEGVLHVFWGLKKPIRLRKSSESSNRRMSFRAAKSPGSSPKVESKHTRNILRKQMHPMISEIADEPGNAHSLRRQFGGRRPRKVSNAAALRPPGKRKEESFVPPYGTYANLRVSSTYTTTEVIDMLLEKFSIADGTAHFALYVAHDHGGVERLSPDSFPLQVRLKLGPSEDVAKIFIMDDLDEGRVDVTPEVAQYINLAIPVLEGILAKYQEEEDREANKIRERYKLKKKVLQKAIVHVLAES